MVAVLSKDQLLQQIAQCKRIVLSGEVSEYVLNNVQSKLAAKMIRNIMLLDEFGLNLPDEYIHRIWESKEKLWALRVKFADRNERVLFFAVGGKFLLTNCFNKKSDKIPASEIRKAERMLHEYLNRKG